MNEISQIYGSSMSLNNAITITLLLVLIIYIIYTAILIYHWRSYSGDIKVTGMTLITYLSTTLPLLLIMTVLAFII